MKVNRIDILEYNKSEIKNIKETVKKLILKEEYKDEIFNIVNNINYNEPHCDAIIWSEKIILLVEMTGERIETKDYNEKPENIKSWLLSNHSNDIKNKKIIKAIHAPKFPNSMLTKSIPKDVLRIACNVNKHLCEYLE